MKTKEQILEEMEAIIARVGWMVTAVFGSEGEPEFAYTVGLAAKGWPELIVFGLPPQTAMAVLNILAERLTDGKTVVRDEPLDYVLEGATVTVIDADRTKADKYMHAARNRDEQYRAAQVVWPDPQHRMPWDEGYDKRYAQLVLRTVH
jgi:hypothetical protein